MKNGGRNDDAMIQTPYRIEERRRGHEKRGKHNQRRRTYIAAEGHHEDSNRGGDERGNDGPETFA